MKVTREIVEFVVNLVLRSQFLVTDEAKFSAGLKNAIDGVFDVLETVKDKP